ncbi:MAG TPA: acyloxyacyl hydrolase [Candidatus Acidoferrales bacterium]|nr:acyloxyacyl hydrolase [Candidatus Acidoferrales bacterium]
MKRFAIAWLLLLLGAAAAPAQKLPSASLAYHAWEFAPIIGGGNGLGHRDNTQFLFTGVRAGWVLSREHLSGWMRGNFEWAGDFMPVYTVYTPQGAVWGASMKPVIWQWNFTHGKRIAPYAAIAGGVLFSRHNVPPGNTSYVNFTPQGAFGMHIFLKPGRALLLEAAVVHHSNASLGTQNPGYNASIFFTVGYSWFRGGRR